MLFIYIIFFINFFLILCLYTILYNFSSACSFFVPKKPSLISSITGYLTRLTSMVISGSQHVLIIYYSILN